MAQLKDILDSVVLIGTEKDYRFLDAWGHVSKYIPNNGDPTDDTTGEPLSWVNTETGTNTWVNSVTSGELYTITTGSTEYNGYSSQVKGEAFKVATGQPFYVGAQIKLSEATEKDFLFGLAETDTTLTAASTAHAIAVSGDGLFFAKIDGSTATSAYVYKDGAETSSVSAGTMDTSYHYYEIVSEDGVTIKFYLDGELVTCVSSSLADGDMTLSLSFRAGSAAAGTLSIKDLKAIQIIS